MFKIVWVALATVLISITLFVGCASRSEIKRFQQQVEYLTTSNARMEKAIARLDSILYEQQILLRQISATQNYDMHQIQDELRIVETILRESGIKVKSLSEKLSAIEHDISSRQNPANDSTVDTSQMPSINAKQLFETAQLDFNRGKYELAAQGFAQFVEIFPKGALADDALYYYGESLYYLGKYSESKSKYLSLVQKYPQSELAPSALYKAAMCAQRLDDMKSMRSLLNQVIEKYPASEEASSAKEKIKAIGQ